MAEGLSADDRRQIARQGIAEDEVERQLELHHRPPRPAKLLAPATLGEGIAVLGEERHAELLEAHARAARGARLSKFVPASGAATRMFQPLAATLQGDGTEADRQAAERLLAELDRFAFAKALEEVLVRRGLGVCDLRRSERLPEVLSALLEPAGLGFLQCPKALVPFHRQGRSTRTPFAEHLAETAGYARGPTHSRMHLTVAPETRGLFLDELKRVRAELEARGDTRFDLSFSSQSPATDTIATDLEGRPFRLDDGTLLFRPGGHGALLWNLDEVSGDIVFVKTVDNVVPEDRRGPTLLWKRLLAGFLVELQGRVFDLLRRLEVEDDGPWLEAGLRFAAEELSIDAARGLLGRAVETQRQRAFLRRELDRPLRICGMVRNTGEPGGGPFWVERSDGTRALQIVESVEIDRDDPEQREILEGSSNFNPVDLVCGLRNLRGEPHDLLDFADPGRAFVARKSQQGRPLQALEHPGLWNGGMAFWNTVFVEVPPETFAPVKTVFDLLRPEHQAS